MTCLLVVDHVVSPDTRELHEEVLAGTRSDGIVGVDVVARPALAASAADLVGADALILGTPANIGYMSGALKHFFDQIYYPLLDALPGLPFGLWVHGNNDTEGAVRAVTTIARAMGWQPAAAPVIVIGGVTVAARVACRELGAVVAATVASDPAP